MNRLKRALARWRDRPVRVPIKVGSQIVLMDGVRVRAHLVLTQVKFDRLDGASAQFEDYSHMMAKVRVR